MVQRNKSEMLTTQFLARCASNVTSSVSHEFLHEYIRFLISNQDNMSHMNNAFSWKDMGMDSSLHLADTVRRRATSSQLLPLLVVVKLTK